MNLSVFIAKRIHHPKENTFSSTIHKVAVITIASGLSIMIIALLIMQGFRSTIQDKVTGFFGHLQITKYTLSSTYEELPVSRDSEYFEKLGEDPYIDHLQGVAHKVGLLKAEEEIHGIIFKGIDQDYNYNNFQKNLREGRFPQVIDSTPAMELMISKKIAGLMKLRLSDEVLIYFIQNPVRARKFSICGIYESGMEEFDDKIILGDIRVIRQLNDWRDGTYGTFEIFIKDLSKLREAEDHLFETTHYDLYVDNIQDKYAEIFDWLNLISRNVTILLVLILFVASFNMISVLIILIMERTQMIGLLKALGTSNRIIRQIFSYSAFRLILNGLFWGNLTGLGLCYLQFRYKVIPLDPENYFMNYVPVEWDWMGIIGLNLIIFLIIGISLYLPLMIISRIRPIRSIKFD